MTWAKWHEIDEIDNIGKHTMSERWHRWHEIDDMEKHTLRELNTSEAHHSSSCRVCLCWTVLFWLTMSSFDMDAAPTPPASPPDGVSSLFCLSLSFSTFSDRFSWAAEVMKNTSGNLRMALLMSNRYSSSQLNRSSSFWLMKENNCGREKHKILVWK